jgi:hypothetical protein
LTVAVVSDTMPRAALVVLAGTDTSADAGRVVNAMTIAREFVAAGDEVQVIFDGAGTQWVPILERADYEYHDLYTTIREAVAVCGFCARAYGVSDAVDAAGVERLAANDGHPSIRSLVGDGYEVLTF